MDGVFERVCWQLANGVIEPSALAELRTTLASSSSWGSPKERYDRFAAALKRALTRDEDSRSEDGSGSGSRSGSLDETKSAQRVLPAAVAGSTPTKTAGLLVTSGGGSTATATATTATVVEREFGPRLARAPDGDALCNTLIDHIEALYRPFIIPTTAAGTAGTAGTAAPATNAAPTAATTNAAGGAASAPAPAPVSAPAPASPNASHSFAAEFTSAKKQALAIEVGSILHIISWLLRYTRLSSGIQRLFQLYAASLQGGLGLGSDLLAVLRLAANASAAPDAYFRFDDTPLFPVINKSVIGNPSGSGSGSAANAGPNTIAGSSIPKGYGWCGWIKLNRIRDNATNLFSFLAENGCGVQTFIQKEKLRIRCLPNASETAPCNRAIFPLTRWFFLAVVHAPPV